MSEKTITGKPFLTKYGEVVTVKSETTIKDKNTMQVISSSIEVNENNTKYKHADLTPMSDKEYQDHLKELKAQEDEC